MPNISGFFLIDKDSSYSSNDIDCLLKRKINVRKAGHLGTLDPFASGLLVIGINDATKLMTILDDSKKTYIATLKLGKETDTLDRDGKVIAEKEIPQLNEAKIKDCLSQFLGKQKQTVPHYSAKHINGVRSYLLARENKDFKAPEIDIDITKIELLSFTEDTIVFKAEVSKGTYIRSLGRDIAYRLNTIGYLEELRRTDVSSLCVANAKKISDTTISDMISVKDMFKDIKVHDCNEYETKKVRNGCPLTLPYSDEYIFTESEGNITALYKKQEDGKYCSYRGFAHD